jgi:hypothetical protein
MHFRRNASAKMRTFGGTPLPPLSSLRQPRKRKRATGFPAALCVCEL